MQPASRTPLLIGALRERTLPFLVAILPFLGTCASVRAADVDTVWNSVAVSGAQCIVTGVITHPADTANPSGSVCIRTDVGGAYRWDSAGLKWIPLTDFLSFAEREYFQAEALAIDPANSDVLYYAGGTYKGQWLPGALFKSTDGGTSWQPTGLSNVKMGGNADRRWAGERLAVDPGNSSVILFGSRSQGLWRSPDGGSSWTQIASIPTASGDIYGVQSVAFDPARNHTVYAAVSGASAGVYVSTDDGVTFRGIGGNTSPRRLQVSSSGILWYTHSQGVSSYNGSSWTNYAPGGTGVCCGLAVNPSNALDILVGNSEPYTSHEKIYRSTDGGAHWNALTISQSSTAPWFSNWGSMWTSSLAFDPYYSGNAWCAEWQTTNINAATVAWKQQELGHEQDVVNSLLTPPSGTYEVLTGSWDDDGFAFPSTSLGTCPSHSLGLTNNTSGTGNWNADTWGIAYQRANPQYMLRIGAQNYDGGPALNVASSTDGGTTWPRVNSFPLNHFPAVCALSATNGNNMLIICSQYYSADGTGTTWTADPNPWLHSLDGGATWQTISGLPTPISYKGQSVHYPVLASDGVNGSRFYYLDYSSGANLYASSDGGQTFTKVSQSGLPTASADWWQLKARPDAEGDLWACIDMDKPTWMQSGRNPSVEGLYHSTDGGVTWGKLANVSRAWAFGFGMAANNGGPAAIYLYGRANGETSETIWESLDLGVSWVNIQSPTNLLGNFPNVIEGSWRTPGRVFVGTAGRGVFYGQGVTSWYEAEALTVAAQTAGIGYTIVSDDRFSNDAGAYFNATAAWQYVTFAVPTIAAGTYDIRVGFKQANNKGIWQLYAAQRDGTGGTNVGPRVDSYQAGEVFTEVDLGTWSPTTTGDKAISFTVTGKNASSSGYGLAIDYIRIIKQ